MERSQGPDLYRASGNFKELFTDDMFFPTSVLATLYFALFTVVIGHHLRLPRRPPAQPEDHGSGLFPLGLLPALHRAEHRGGHRLGMDVRGQLRPHQLRPEPDRHRQGKLARRRGHRDPRPRHHDHLGFRQLHRHLPRRPAGDSHAPTSRRSRSTAGTPGISSATSPCPSSRPSSSSTSL